MALGLLLSVGAGLTAGESLAPPRGAVHEVKDSHGRVVRRVVFRPEGELQTEAFVYQAVGLLSSEEQHLDAERKTVRRIKESFDAQGRLVEREDLAAVDGRMVGSRVRYQYDARGGRSEERTTID